MRGINGQATIALSQSGTVATATQRLTIKDVLLEPLGKWFEKRGL